MKRLDCVSYVSNVKNKQKGVDMAVINPHNYSRPVGSRFKINVSEQKLATDVKPTEYSQKDLSKRADKGLNQQDKYLEQKIMSAKPEELVPT